MTSRKAALERQAPANVTAEQLCLSAAMVHASALTLVLEELPRDSFWSSSHRMIREAMERLARAGDDVDLFTVESELERRNQLERVGGRKYLNDLAQAFPVGEHVGTYIRQVRRAAANRRMIPVLEAALDAAYADADLLPTVEALDTQIRSARNEMPKPAAPALPTLAELQTTEFAEPRWAVQGIIAEGFSLLVGAEKLGKSWLALNLGLSIAAGGVALGRIPVDPARVLYLTLEDKRRRLKRRVETLLGSDPWPELFHYHDEWPTLDRGGIAQLDAWCTAHPDTKLIVIDILRRIRPEHDARRGLVDQDYSDVARLKDLADRHHVAIVGIHHTNRGEKRDFVDRVSGTRGLGASADALLILDRERGQRGATLWATGRDIEEQKLLLELDIHAGGWTLVGDASSAAAALTPERQQIVDLLRECGPLQPNEIAEMLSRNRTTVRGLCLRMAAAGELLNDGGIYRVPSTPSTGSTPPFSQAQIGLSDPQPEGKQGPQQVNPAVEGVHLFTPVDPDQHVYPDQGVEGGTGALPTPENLAPLVFSADLSRPPSDREAHARRRIFLEAYARGWPRVVIRGDGGAQTVIDACEEHWRHVCAAWDRPAFRMAIDALKAAEEVTP